MHIAKQFDETRCPAILLVDLLMQNSASLTKQPAGPSFEVRPQLLAHALLSAASNAHSLPAHSLRDECPAERHG